MIKLNDNYKIDFDTMNIILYKKNITTEKSKNPGEEIYKVIGYFGDFKSLSNKLLKEEISISDAKNFSELINVIKDFKESIIQELNKLED